MNERDLDIAWVDAELAFMEIQKQYEGTRRNGRDEDGDGRPPVKEEINYDADGRGNGG